MGDADVHRALTKLIVTRDEAEIPYIPYAIAGAMALNEYGYRRVTTDVGVLLTADGLRELKARVQSMRRADARSELQLEEKDLADVLELVRATGMSREMVDSLDPSVREKFLELWDGAQTEERE